MNTLLLKIAAVLIVLHVLLGVIISAYSAFNVFLSCLVIAVTCGMICLMKPMGLSVGFRVSLTFIYSFIGVLCWIASLFSPSSYKDNWCFIIILVLLAIEAIFLFSTQTVSKINKQ